jgi:hypothetical protein
MDKPGLTEHLYVIEAIVSHQTAPGVKGGYKFQIQCKGYDDVNMTWEPAANLSNAKQILDNDRKQHSVGERNFK